MQHVADFAIMTHTTNCLNAQHASYSIYLYLHVTPGQCDHARDPLITMVSVTMVSDRLDGLCIVQ